MTRPKIRISDLRAIGWAHWDPIGLKDLSGAIPDGARDEYDSYLMRAAGMLINGEGSAAAAAYLTDIAADHMSLGEGDLKAAEATVRAIGEKLRKLGYEVA